MLMALNKSPRWDHLPAACTVQVDRLRRLARLTPPVALQTRKKKPRWTLFILSVVLVAFSSHPQASLFQYKPPIRCITFSYIEICADLMRLHPGRAGARTLFDIPAAERSLRKAVLAQIGIEPTALARLHRRHPVAVRWNRLVKATTVQGAHSLSMLPHPDLLKATRKLLPDLFKVWDELRIGVKVRLEEPTPISTNRSGLRIVCKLELISSGRSASGRNVDRMLDQCASYQARGFRSVGNSQTDEGWVLRQFFLFTWTFFLYEESYRNHLAKNPRDVFVFRAPGNRSPRVDAMGSLYLPNDMVEPGNAQVLQLILAHEAGHVAMGPVERLQALFKALAQKLTGREARSEQERDQAKAAIESLFSNLGLKSEPHADLFALYTLRAHRSSRAVYAKVLQRYERAYPERIEMVKLVNDALKPGVRPARLVSIAFLAPMLAPNTGNLSRAESKFAQRYQRLYTRYFSALATRFSVDIAPPEALATGLDPEALESQVFTFYDHARTELKKMLKRSRR